MLKEEISIDKKMLIQKLIDKVNQEIETDTYFLKTYKIPEHDEKRDLFRMSQQDLESSSSKIYSTARSLFENKRKLQVLINLHDTIKPTSQIGLGSIVVIECHKIQIYFLLPVCGGTRIEINIGEEVKVISSNAPLGQGLIGKTKDDRFIIGQTKFPIHVLDVA